ncbi:lasso peptide biosynthesis B2 protein [Luteimonas changyuni]|uniref:lasso peptide biosynthesis B2 protein n=1 Tax=Luteimonas sp. MJ145 TaxID=3129234 RepID=UPI0031BB453B
MAEQLVLLDVGNDQYFRLPHQMERALVAHLSGDSDGDISELIERSILVAKEDASTQARPRAEPVARSAMEAPPSQQSTSVREILDVLAIVMTSRVELKFSALKTILDSLTTTSHIRTALSGVPRELLEKQVWDAAATFRQARLYVPVGMTCLLDAIAMTRFLRKRKLHSNLVFGVALDPFSAHCWVQTADTVLNDTVGNVHAHTPIRVV